MPRKAANLTNTLKQLEKDTNGTKISVHDILLSLSGKGFGGLLIILSLIVLMPTGAIPGVPLFFAILIFFTSLQILIGSDHVWLPKKIKTIKISRAKYQKSIDYVTPYTKKIDRFFFPRLTFLTKGFAQKIIAVFCLVLSVLIAFLGLIPFMAMIPASGVALFGLGIGARDGVPILMAFFLTLLSVLIALSGLSL